MAYTDESKEEGLVEKLVEVNRVAKVVQGGRKFGFTALTVVGDGDGRVGIGRGKANEVPPSVEKGVKQAMEEGCLAGYAMARPTRST